MSTYVYCLTDLARWKHCQPSSGLCCPVSGDSMTILSSCLFFLSKNLNASASWSTRTPPTV